MLKDDLLFEEIKAVCDGIDVSVQTELLTEASSLLAVSKKATTELAQVLIGKGAIKGGKEQAEYSKDVIIPAMNELRKAIDTLEGIVDKEIWPVPSYTDLLFDI